MTATRGDELMAELRTLRSRNRHRKVSHVRHLQRLRLDADVTIAEAIAILALLPAEPPAVTAARRAVLVGDAVDPDVVSAIGGDIDAPGWAVRAAAEAILLHLPRDPDAAAHRRALLAEPAGPDSTPAPRSHP